jgi:hypothetical protein
MGDQPTHLLFTLAVLIGITVVVAWIILSYPRRKEAAPGSTVGNANDHGTLLEVKKR